MIGRSLSPTYSVSGQITAEDVAAIKAAGFTKVICNRPDAEVPAAVGAAAIRAAAEAAGLAFVDNPFSHAAFGMALVDAQEDAAAEGKVLAYCASGNRSTILWAMAQARSGAMSPEAIVATAARAGYDLSGLARQLEAIAPG